MSTTTRSRAGRVIAGLLASLLCAGCFEFDAPVEERLEIFFHADGSVEVSAWTHVRPAWQSFEGHPGVEARLESLREEILHGEDLWTRSVKAMEPSKERVSWDCEKGDLVRAQRQALHPDPRAVDSLFSLTPVSASVGWEGASTLDTPSSEPLSGSGSRSFPAPAPGTPLTLELVPSTAGLATQRQRNQAEEALAAFSEAVAAHVEGLADLYRYLESAPALKKWALASMVDEKVEPPGEAPSVEEAEALIEAAQKPTEAFLKILEVAEGEAYTLDEISRLVHDPFPAPVVVEVEGRVEEVEGFRSGGDGRYRTRRHGLWDALETLEGRWISPIPVVAWLQAIRQVGDPDQVDKHGLVESLLARPLAVRDVPDAEQVRAAFIQEMTPPDRYLLRWRLPEARD